MHAVRDLLAAALLLVAAVLGALWVPASWVERTVIDQQGFLAVTQPLADDPDFQRTLTDSAVAEILGDERVPDWVSERVTPLAEEQAARITGTQLYGSLWDVTMRELHGALFAPGPSDLDVDLGPAVDSILTGLEDHLPFGIQVPRPDDATVTLATIPDVPLLTKASGLAPWADRLGPIALLLVLVALTVAAHRRVILTLAGVGGILAGLAVWWLAGSIETVVPDSVDQAVFLGPVVQVFQERFAAEVMPQGVIMMGAGALVMAVGLVLLGLRRTA
ncbi:hypothetical protein M3C58_05000 [Brachybacterium muris]|uniref:Uncharacterized protein n=1 Tax=Brachybacterium muris UCD-AY4 TaxID=1249481 RepID=A0A022L0N6_9MICO|nr:hypothetical protein [Brachybacterium muris]EYT50700.1 hypothetical protein D641_0102480 [Brachybacterium muris UCD-AY4]MBM7499763.1 hypothetical protein [Brachybacterium muris]MCT1430058.1 hypothetical protein [Brachybacterium muris]MCT1997562.1 hypothetical protein [Brachybacterium muris]MCT2177709.1 hypothetical protein [Brachybacterium muris]